MHNSKWLPTLTRQNSVACGVGVNLQGPTGGRVGGLTTNDGLVYW